MSTTGESALHECIEERIDARTRHTNEWFATNAERIARLCFRVAQRFERGGRLLAIGDTAVAHSDVRHIVVEFVHPVIVGKRALPAIGFTGPIDKVANDVNLIGERDDIVFAFGGSSQLSGAIGVARERGCLTVAFDEIGAEWTFQPLSNDPFVRQELVETLYHVVWELVHVFFEHRGLLDETPTHAASEIAARSSTNGGAAGFLYPFLANDERDLDAVVANVTASVVMKANDVTALRIATVAREDSRSNARGALVEAAHLLRRAFDGGGKLLAFGNGGSATDAADAVADYRSPPNGWTPRPALDLSEDSAILTALANDIGPDALFSRQIIAHGRSGDVAMAFSTSGGSRNVIQALSEARRRGMRTIAFVGYDGGPIAAEQLADCVILSSSQYIPRIQEAQASAHHIVRELVELVGEHQSTPSLDGSTMTRSAS